MVIKEFNIQMLKSPLNQERYKQQLKKLKIDQHEPYQTKTIIILKTRHHAMQ